MIKESMDQEGIRILNLYVPNNWAPRHMKWKLIELKRERDKSIITVRLQHTSLHNQQAKKAENQ